jgi:hypothetical protein
MSTIYLESDDEITTAIARLRNVSDGEVVLVVPPGSRVATSRINFKLLAREANERKLNIAAVSDDPAVRALAVSAGLPTYDTIGAAENALTNFREQDRKLAERISQAPGEGLSEEDAEALRAARPPLWSSTRSSDTSVMPTPVVDAPPSDPRAEPRSEPPATDLVRSPDFAAGRARMGATGSHFRDSAIDTREMDARLVRDNEERRQRGRRRGFPVAPLVVVALVALLVAGVAYGAYVLLPTATVTLTPETAMLRLDPFTVTADPGTAVVDPVTGTLPAQSIVVPLHVSDTFNATGTQVSETKATGSVRFRSENTVSAVNIPAGTFVATEDGIEFVTLEAAVVPPADFGTSTPGTVNVPVRAVRSGPSGNVAEHTIILAPRSISTQLVSVNNPAPTTGGERIETSVITQKDYDKAVATLTGRLDNAMAVALADPNSVPRGLTAYPATATHDAPTVGTPSGELVGLVATEFDLALDATGHVLAVNEAVIDDIASARLQSALGPAQQEIGPPPVITFGPGAVANGLISYVVDASVLTYTAPDQASLVNQVRGKTITEAKSILSPYGAVDIVIWPDFIDRLPDQASRISLTVTPPTAGS